jgi:hypothetical protein
MCAQGIGNDVLGLWGYVDIVIAVFCGRAGWTQRQVPGEIQQQWSSNNKQRAAGKLETLEETSSVFTATSWPSCHTGIISRDFHSENMRWARRWYVINAVFMQISYFISRVSRFQVVTAVRLKVTAFWDIAPCSLVEEGRRFRSLMMEVVHTS